MGRRFKGPSRLAQVEDVSSEEEENQEEDVKVSGLKVETIMVPKMKTTPTNSILLQMTSTSSWKTDSKLWKSRKCLDWILES